MGKVTFADPEPTSINDIEKAIQDLSLEREALLGKAVQHVTSLKQFLPSNRKHWGKKRRHNLTESRHYQTGLHVMKQVKILEKRVQELEDLREKTKACEPIEQIYDIASENSSLINNINCSLQSFEKKFQITKQRTYWNRKQLVYALFAFCLFTSPFLPVVAVIPKQRRYQSEDHLQYFTSYVNGTKTSIERFTNPSVVSSPPPSASSFMGTMCHAGVISRNLTSEARELSASFHSILTCIRPLEEDQMRQVHTMPEKHCIHGVKEKFIYYSAEQILAFYKDIKHIGAGGEHTLYKVTLRDDRNEVDAGSSIALRIRMSVPKTVPRIIPEAIKAYSKLEILRRSQISNYIPPFYGFYYGPHLPELKKAYVPEEGMIMYTEMELMDTTYEKEYMKEKKLVSARVICEALLGQWALQKVAKIYIGDDRLRQYGLKWDEDYLVYHIGKRAYLFPPGYSPRRLDLDIFFIEGTPEAPFSWNEKDNFLYKRAEFQNLKNLYEEINTKGLFRSIEDNLQEFEVSEKNPIPHKGVKHLYISEEDMVL
ncbi:MAG: hypothetical protein K2Y08_00700 [Alphaproteobacteria bacterium]|nr:hypothetical protein [Alphaproteobacteria bacterium]